MFGMFKKIPALILGAGLICSSVQNEDFGYLWLGALDDADKQPVLWRVLAVGGNGATYTNDAGEPCEKPLFLLTDDLLGLHQSAAGNASGSLAEQRRAQMVPAFCGGLFY